MIVFMCTHFKVYFARSTQTAVHNSDLSLECRNRVNNSHIFKYEVGTYG